MEEIRVMIVDDQLIVREGLKKLLEISDNIKVVAEASNGMDCLELIDKVLPSIILMDIKMPGITGIETTRLIRQRYSEIKIIMITIYDDPELVSKAIHEGANGYLMKNATRDKIMRCINHVINDSAFLDPLVTSSVLEHIQQSNGRSSDESDIVLTKRELEVLEKIVSGLTDKEIADRLNISEHTVRSHIKNTYRKMGVSTRAQAAVKAITKGIIRES